MKRQPKSQCLSALVTPIFREVGPAVGDGEHTTLNDTFFGSIKNREKHNVSLSINTRTNKT